MPDRWLERIAAPVVQLPGPAVGDAGLRAKSGVGCDLQFMPAAPAAAERVSWRTSSTGALASHESARSPSASRPVNDGRELTRWT